MRRLLLLAVLGIACADEPPPPGTPIGVFAFVGDLMAATPEATLAIPACPAEELPFCTFPGSEDPLSFSAVLSFDPDTSAFFMKPDTTAAREGALDGTVFETVAPGQVECGDPGVQRSIPACTGCRITATEWIRGELLERKPVEGCPDPGAPAPAPLEGAFDPAVFGAVCGTLYVRVQLSPATEEADCMCDEETIVDGQRKIEKKVTSGPCVVVYTLTGTRT